MQLIAEGNAKFASVPAGGAVASSGAAAAGGAAPAAAEEKAEEKKEEEKVRTIAYSPAVVILTQDCICRRSPTTIWASVYSTKKSRCIMLAYFCILSHVAFVAEYTVLLTRRDTFF